MSAALTPHTKAGRPLQRAPHQKTKGKHMPQTQDTDDAVAAVNFPPIPAGRHLSHLDKTSPVPAPPSIYPLAPWRTVLLITGLTLAMFCGIPAAAPVWNGADLGVFLSLVIFVAAFTPWKD